MRVAFASALVVTAAFGLVLADTVVRRRGPDIEGTVISVDGDHVVIETPSGRMRLPRAEVAAVQFASPAPALKVEIRNVRSDDAVDVLLNDEVVVREAGEGGEWVDLTPKLKEGNNALRLRIRNDRGTWAYRLSLRLNGEVVPLACGTPLRTNDPCTCCGKEGRETGIVDDLPVLWIHVDRALGKAEVLP